MKFGKTFFLVTAILIVYSSNVFAMEQETQGDLEFETTSLETTVEDSIKEQADILTMDDFSSNVSEELKNGLNSYLKKSDEINALNATSTLYTPDQYEPNNNSGVATAGIKNKLISANIHTANDEDWYQIDVTQSDLDESEGIIAVILTNIPNDCDYDLFILKIMSNGQVGQLSSELTGNSTESIYINGEVGTYYAVVDPKKGISNNVSPQSYSFYFGQAVRQGTTGYMDLGMTFNFGYKDYGDIGKSWLSPYQEIDLSNASFIPNQALISKLYISDDSNGAYWIGFCKIVNGIEQMGNFSSALPLKENQYLAKQLYQVQGKFVKSDGFIWKPKMKIDYKYPLTLQNLSFLTQ